LINKSFNKNRYAISRYSYHLYYVFPSTILKQHSDVALFIRAHVVSLLLLLYLYT